MPEIISNTSPLLFLHRIDAFDWLPQLFGETWIPKAVIHELEEAQRIGYDVPNFDDFPWLKIVDPHVLPSEWIATDLGAGELAAMALALENPTRIILLDDALARRIAQAAGLHVWGTLKVLLEAKSQGITESVKPHLQRLKDSGMWISDKILERVLALAGEKS